MDDQEIERRFRELKVWKRGGIRAPHKPLLLLYALGRVSRGESRYAPFAQINGEVGELLRRFGDPRPTEPRYPFWWLQEDGLWEVPDSDAFERRRGHCDPKTSELIKHGAVVGFISSVHEALTQNDQLFLNVVHALLDHSFPASLHEGILDAVGLADLVRGKPHRRRDRKFRDAVLSTYGFRCVVCGFDIRLGDSTVCLDAAHIRWHGFGGPDVERNGLALCSLHHQLFDLGAFTVTPEGLLVVSKYSNGGQAFEQYLLRHHGQAVRGPQDPSHRPAQEFLAWHSSQVFRHPVRYLPAAGSSA